MLEGMYRLQNNNESHGGYFLRKFTYILDKPRGMDTQHIHSEDRYTAGVPPYSRVLHDHINPVIIHKMLV